MLLHDLILELRGGVAAAVEELFTAAYANQTHPQVLLLVDQHGFYRAELVNTRPHGSHRLSPYVIGPDEIGFGQSTLYEFVDWFRNSHMLDKAVWEKQLVDDAEMQKHERDSARASHLSQILGGRLDLKAVLPP